MSDVPLKNAPTLLCFDSGVGGLAVLTKLLAVIPHCSYTFLGDTAWMPYGEKPQSSIKKRMLELHAALDVQHNIAAFVLACNTATAAAYDDLIAQQLPYPILEPVETTAQWLNTHASSGTKVGILATPGTVQSQRYLRFLKPDLHVTQVACTGLASLIESGWQEGPELEAMVQMYWQPLRAAQVDIVVLGCTHYSLIQPVIRALLPSHVQLVDSATLLAQKTLPYLQQLPLQVPPQQHIRVTGNPQLFAQAIQQLSLPFITDIPIVKSEHLLAETLG